VGSAEGVNVDCRVIAATNKDLEREIAAGNFRDDLFFRLNVIPFHMPALRDRREDIPALVDHFIEEFCAEYGKKPKKASAEAMELLMAYQWPGNVRELKNVIERLVIMVASEEIGAKDLPPPLRKGREESDGLGDSPLASASWPPRSSTSSRSFGNGNASHTGRAPAPFYRKMKARDKVSSRFSALVLAGLSLAHACAEQDPRMVQFQPLLPSAALGNQAHDPERATSTLTLLPGDGVEGCRKEAPGSR
jgi:two-component system nitrogen regulation response regulator NtrX